MLRGYVRRTTLFDDAPLPPIMAMKNKLAVVAAAIVVVGLAFQFLFRYDYMKQEPYSGRTEVSLPHDMSARTDLAAFVKRTLDNAELVHAKQTWIDLIEHGGRDGGGMQSTHSATGIMRADDIAGAIAESVAAHSKDHPRNTGRVVDGVLANQ